MTLGAGSLGGLLAAATTSAVVRTPADFHKDALDTLNNIFDSTLAESNLTREDLVNPETVVKFNAYLPGLYEVVSERLNIPVEAVKWKGSGLGKKKVGPNGSYGPSFMPEP